MKYFGIFVLCLCFVFAIALLKASTARAFGFGSSPYGGRVVFTGPQGNFMCDTGVGPVTQMSAGSSPSSYYFYSLTNKTTPPRVGSWTLGNYQTTPDFTSCYYN